MMLSLSSRVHFVKCTETLSQDCISYLISTIKSGNIVTWYKLRHLLAKSLSRHKTCSFRDIYFSQKHFDIQIFLVKQLFE